MSSAVPPRRPRHALHAVRVTSASESAARDSATIAAGVPVRALPVGDTRTEDARAERALAEPLLEQGSADGAALLIDGLLGTGSRGAPRGEIAEAISRINLARAGGARVVAIDVPSGVDADTGDATHAVRADVTLTFGTLKRGLVVAATRQVASLCSTSGSAAGATTTPPRSLPNAG